ncbi:universal stress protein PHOS32-like isoform X2 [Aristolochia californica]|uniref:universal stress protein PHOS32-like isoform X2 n=1 Tax=Aristolochia californica TaxID=171875 RepID=UPI0035DE1DF4
MGRTSPRLASFCLNRLTTRVRVRSPTIESKPIARAIKCDPATVRFSGAGDGMKAGFVVGRRIMIVVDSSQEAKSAVHWALTHTVQSQDTLILLYVTRSERQGEESHDQKETNPRGYQLLRSLKNSCQIKKPGLEVAIVSVEGRKKGPTIVEEANKQGISLLVLGQRKKSTMTWRLLMTWARSKIGGGTVEYCIQNAECMTVAVRRKSRKLGGYLITTKRHKDFWLLA